MDGVLVDGEPLHYAGVCDLLAEDGWTLSLDQYKPYMGTKSGWADLVRDLGLPQSPEQYAESYHGRILARYEADSVALPGAVALVEGLRSRGVPVAVASSSIRPWVEACLGRVGLLRRFDALITGSDVVQGKPAPDIYLLAAERLGVAPQRCVAFEDAPAGVAAAKAAGMTCWAVRTEYTAGLELPGADRIYDSLLQVDLRDIAKAAA